MRAVFGGAIVTALSILATPGSSVQAVDYDFVSVYSSATPLAEVNATAPSVNNAGTVAFAALIPDPAANRSTYVVFRSAGGQLVALLNLTDSLGAGSPGPLVINEGGAIALHYARGIEGLVVRIQPDGSYAVLARSDQFASTPYLEIAPAVSMNGTGQVAALVTNTDLTSSIVRFDAAGAVEVARSSPDLVNFSPPAINDAGVVAFTAQGASAGNVHVYSGTGGSLTDEGAIDPCPGPSHTPAINNDGLVLSDCGGPPLFSARGGVVNVLLTGSEDPIFGRLTSGYGLSNRAQTVFVTGSAEGPPEVGLFTGNDPLSGKVLRTGDTVFELPVEDIAIGHRSVNDTGQIALLLQVGGERPTTHIILATPRRTPQEITFPDLANPIFGGPPLPMTATASSGLPVTFAASGACALAAGAVTLLGAGNCTVTASQGGDSTYAPAPDVSQTLSIGRAAQAIDFGVVARGECRGRQERSSSAKGPSAARATHLCTVRLHTPTARATAAGLSPAATRWANNARLWGVVRGFLCTSIRGTSLAWLGVWRQPPSQRRGLGWTFC